MRGDSDGVLGLLVAVLRGVPRLDGALCRDRHTLFDGDQGTADFAAERAQDLCFRCPVLHDCATWAAGQPDTRLHGVIAGRVYGRPA